MNRIIALFLLFAIIAPVTGPSAALALTTAHDGGGHESVHHEGAQDSHHQGCPWRGTPGPCPHAHGGSDRELAFDACGMDPYGAHDSDVAVFRAQPRPAYEWTPLLASSTAVAFELSSRFGKHPLPPDLHPPRDLLS